MHVQLIMHVKKNFGGNERVPCRDLKLKSCHVITWGWFSSSLIKRPNRWFQGQPLNWEGRREFFQRSQPNYKLVSRCALTVTAILRGANKTKLKALRISKKKASCQMRNHSHYHVMIPLHIELFFIEVVRYKVKYRYFFLNIYNRLHSSNNFLFCKNGCLNISNNWFICVGLVEG